MPTTTQEKAVSQVKTPDALVARVAKGVQRAAGVAFSTEARWLERMPWAVALLLVGLYAALAVQAARVHLLWSDELYTWHIATQPTIGKMLGLAREVDLHPPLSYLLERWSLKLPLPLDIAARVPNLLAGAVLVYALYRMSERRFGGAIAVTSVAVFLLGRPLTHAWENRPYMMLFCLVTLLFGAWVQAARPGRAWWRLPVVFGVSLLMNLDHLLAVVCLALFAVAELWRAWERRRVDVPMALALFLPGLVGLGLWYQVSHLRQNSFAAAHMASMDTMANTYGAVLEQFLFTLVWCVVAASLLPRGSRQPEGTTRTMEAPWRGAEVLLLGLFALMPLWIYVVGGLSGAQVWQRYGFAGVGPTALLLTQVVALYLPAPRAIGVMLLAASVGMTLGRFSDSGESDKVIRTGTKRLGERMVDLNSLQGGLPLVVGDPIVYTEMAHREQPALTKRLFYLTDRDLAVQYSGYTLFENEGKIVRLMGMPTQVEGFREFEAEHKQFYLLGDLVRPEEWVLRALMAEGAHLQFLGRADAGYEDDGLFLVTLR